MDACGAVSGSGDRCGLLRGHGSVHAALNAAGEVCCTFGLRSEPGGPLDDVYRVLGFEPPVLRVDVVDGVSTVSEVVPAKAFDDGGPVTAVGPMPASTLRPEVRPEVRLSDEQRVVVDRLATNLGLTPDERAVAERGWGYEANRARDEGFVAGVAAQQAELQRRVTLAEEERLRTLLTERVARAIHDVTLEHMGGVSPFVAHGQAEAAVGVFVDFLAGRP